MSGMWSRYFKAQRLNANPEYRKKINAKRRKAYQKNKVKIRPKANEYYRELRKISLEIGNCANCFQPKPKDKFKTCLKCRLRFRKYSKKYLQKKRGKEKQQIK